jgi:integrase
MMQRHALRTVASTIIGLKCVLQRMAPDRDWRWLKDLTNRLDAWAEPSRDRCDEILSARDVFHGALRDLERLAARKPMRRRDEIAFRDVLMVALLAACPVRMRNLLQIEIDTHLQRAGDGWDLVFEGPETKNGQPLRFVLAPDLVPWLELYLERVRPGFRIATGCQRLWPGAKAQPLAYAANALRQAYRCGTGGFARDAEQCGSHCGRRPAAHGAAN